MVNAVRHGMSNPQISKRLNVSLDAVKFHVANAVEKLGLRNRTALKHWSGAPVDSALEKSHAMATVAAPASTIGPVGQIDASSAFAADSPNDRSSAEGPHAEGASAGFRPTPARPKRWSGGSRSDR